MEAVRKKFVSANSKFIHTLRLSCERECLKIGDRRSKVYAECEG